MRCAIPPPGDGLLGPPVPTVVPPLLACSRPPALHRSDCRSCCLGGYLDGDSTIIANKYPVAFLSFCSLFLLPIILTVFSCFNKYLRHSRGRHPPGPPDSHKWPIRALGSHQPNSKASQRAPRAALPHIKGRSWPTSLRGLQQALGSPLAAQSRALAHHPCTPRMRALPAHRRPRAHGALLWPSLVGSEGISSTSRVGRCSGCAWIPLERSGSRVVSARPTLPPHASCGPR